MPPNRPKRAPGNEQQQLHGRHLQSRLQTQGPPEARGKAGRGSPGIGLFLVFLEMRHVRPIVLGPATGGGKKGTALFAESYPSDQGWRGKKADDNR